MSAYCMHRLLILLTFTVPCTEDLDVVHDLCTMCAILCHIKSLKGCIQHLLLRTKDCLFLKARALIKARPCHGAQKKNDGRMPPGWKKKGKWWWGSSGSSNMLSTGHDVKNKGVGDQEGYPHFGVVTVKRHQSLWAECNLWRWWMYWWEYEAPDW